VTKAVANRKLSYRMRLAQHANIQNKSIAALLQKLLLCKTSETNGVNAQLA
jgi:hypothetical protein